MIYNIFELPLPPTKNQIHSVGRSRLFLTKKALDWYEEAGKILLTYPDRPKKPISAKIAVHIFYQLKKDRDIDSGECILDLLQRQMVIENDRQVYRLIINKTITSLRPGVIINLISF